MKNTKNTLLSIAIIAALPFTANATQTIVETNTPAAVGANGTVKKAADSGPYQTATIGEHDDEHIATTAYVKGAYNDAIAAVNKVDADKQNQLYNGNMKITGIQNADEFAAIVDDVVRDRIMNGTSVSSISSSLQSAVGNVLPTSAGVVEGIMAAAEFVNDNIYDAKQDKLYSGDSTAISNLVVPAYEIASYSVDEMLGVVLNGEPASALVSDLDNEGFGDQLTTFGGVIAAVTTGVEETKGYVDAELANKRVRIYTTWGTDTVAATTLVPFENAQ